MQIVEFANDIISVNNGKLGCKNKELLELANAILEGSFGKFNNSEVYPDRDHAIANYITKKLSGK